MPDSPIINGIRPSTEEVTDVNGATVSAQHVQRMLLAISPTDGTAVDLPGDSTYGLGVDVKRMPQVALDAATLVALETIQANTGLDLSALATATKQDAAKTTLDAILTELGQKLETGQAVALDATTLTALEQVTATIANLPGAASGVSYGSGTANQTPVAPADATGRLLGYAIRETTGSAAATVRFRSGTTVAGTPLGAGVTLAANESVREWFGPSGINVPTAIFLERIAGDTEVTVYWAAP